MATCAKTSEVTGTIDELSLDDVKKENEQLRKEKEKLQNDKADLLQQLNFLKAKEILLKVFQMPYQLSDKIYSIVHPKLYKKEHHYTMYDVEAHCELDYYKAVCSQGDDVEESVKTAKTTHKNVIDYIGYNEEHKSIMKKFADHRVQYAHPQVQFKDFKLIRSDLSKYKDYMPFKKGSKAVTDFIDNAKHLITLSENLRNYNMPISVDKLPEQEAQRKILRLSGLPLRYFTLINQQQRLIAHIQQITGINTLNACNISFSKRTRHNTEMAVAYIHFKTQDEATFVLHNLTPRSKEFNSLFGTTTTIEVELVRARPPRLATPKSEASSDRDGLTESSYLKKQQYLLSYDAPPGTVLADILKDIKQLTTADINIAEDGSNKIIVTCDDFKTISEAEEQIKHFFTFPDKKQHTGSQSTSSAMNTWGLLDDLFTQTQEDTIQEDTIEEDTLQEARYTAALASALDNEGHPKAQGGQDIIIDDLSEFDTDGQEDGLLHYLKANQGGRLLSISTFQKKLVSHLRDQIKQVFTDTTAWVTSESYKTVDTCVEKLHLNAEMIYDVSLNKQDRKKYGFNFLVKVPEEISQSYWIAMNVMEFYTVLTSLCCYCCQQDVSTCKKVCSNLGDSIHYCLTSPVHPDGIINLMQGLIKEYLRVYKHVFEQHITRVFETDLWQSIDQLFKYFRFFVWLNDLVTKEYFQEEGLDKYLLLDDYHCQVVKAMIESQLQKDTAEVLNEIVLDKERGPETAADQGTKIADYINSHKGVAIPITYDFQERLVSHLSKQATDALKYIPSWIKKQSYKVVAICEENLPSISKRIYDEKLSRKDRVKYGFTLISRVPKNLGKSYWIAMNVLEFYTVLRSICGYCCQQDLSTCKAVGKRMVDLVNAILISYVYPFGHPFHFNRLMISLIKEYFCVYKHVFDEHITVFKPDLLQSINQLYKYFREFTLNNGLMLKNYLEEKDFEKYSVLTDYRGKVVEAEAKIQRKIQTEKEDKRQAEIQVLINLGIADHPEAARGLSVPPYKKATEFNTLHFIVKVKGASYENQDVVVKNMTRYLHKQAVGAYSKNIADSSYTQHDRPACKDVLNEATYRMIDFKNDDTFVDHPLSEISRCPGNLKKTYWIAIHAVEFYHIARNLGWHYCKTQENCVKVREKIEYFPHACKTFAETSSQFNSIMKNWLERFLNIYRHIFDDHGDAIPTDALGGRVTFLYQYFYHFLENNDVFSLKYLEDNGFRAYLNCSLEFFQQNTVQRQKMLDRLHRQLMDATSDDWKLWKKEHYDDQRMCTRELRVKAIEAKQLIRALAADGGPLKSQLHWIHGHLVEFYVNLRLISGICCYSQQPYQKQDCISAMKVMADVGAHIRKCYRDEDTSRKTIQDLVLNYFHVFAHLLDGDHFEFLTEHDFREEVQSIYRFFYDFMPYTHIMTEEYLEENGFKKYCFLNEYMEARKAEQIFKKGMKKAEKKGLKKR